MKPLGPFCIAWTGCQFTDEATPEQIAALPGTNASFEGIRVTTIYAELAPTVEPVHQRRVIRLTCEPISADPERLRAILAD